MNKHTYKHSLSHTYKTFAHYGSGGLTVVTEARQTDRCNIWTICFYKHITFCVSLSLSLTAGLCFTWPDLPLMGSIAAKCQTHTLTHANTFSLLIHFHSPSLFCFSVGSSTWYLLHTDYWRCFWICAGAKDSLQNFV